ncbi:class I SAM-dependent methyltransferase [Rugamonas sp. CCM 8940]|uniref:class I SAM-dependent methyltransferase n=1 Tax=Rugamonas sp. CCM 8940 TaxID=2765359 RepID=UPI0018F559B2|nr:class I SAM-dependent methyltransferase [Rugamonas sp. CCM 8940]MBJ7312550.1 class I SAM-dependent methyltransferase [Rugamonas sp. CCM 8940]
MQNSELNDGDALTPEPLRRRRNQAAAPAGPAATAQPIAHLNQPQLTQQRFGAKPCADGTLEHGWLRIASARQEIDSFVAERETAQQPVSASVVKTVLAAAAQDTEVLLAQLAGLDADLMAASRRFLASHAPGSLGRDGFCRYALEGARDCYASRGINADVMACVLGLQDLRGLAGVDLGFGNGEVLQALRQAGARMTGLELSPWFVQHARQRGLTARMAQVDIDRANMEREFGLSAQSQDFVISTMVLDRVASPRNYLKNMLALLKVGGRFALQTILPVSPVDDGDTAQPIIYTAVANRIVPGQDEQQDKVALVRGLRELGAGAIDVRTLPYAIASRDGLQHYTVWSFSGAKRAADASDSAPCQRIYHTNEIGGGNRFIQTNES